MKRWLKFSLFIIVILTTVVLTSTVVLGWDYRDFRPNGSGNAIQQMKNISVNFTAIFKLVGYSLGVFFTLVLAIQFMMATPTKKAELKTRAWMFVLGIVLLIAIPTFMGWIADFGKDIQDSTKNGGSSGVSAPSGGYIDVFSATTPSTPTPPPQPASVSSPANLGPGDTITAGGTTYTLSAGDVIYQTSDYGTTNGWALKKADGKIYDLGTSSGANQFGSFNLESSMVV